jgi:hypothetical protein
VKICATGVASRLSPKKHRNDRSKRTSLRSLPRHSSTFYRLKQRSDLVRLSTRTRPV